MQVSKKLIVEQPTYDYDVIKEEQNLSTKPLWYINGPQMAHSMFNKNGRKYLKEEMDSEVEKYTREKINTKRSWGELEHSDSPSVSLKSACDLLLNLEADGNYYVGKSLVMDTNNGLILQAILKSGSKPGRSTRALGALREGVGGHIVNGLQLIAVDTVADPSTESAFVNGILESKEFICNANGIYERNFDKFEKGLSKYPSIHRDDINRHILKTITDIMKSW